MAKNQQSQGLKVKNLSCIKKVFFNIVLLVFSLAICLVVIEWTVRLVLPVYDPSGNIIFRTNPDGVSLGPPNFKGRQWKNTGDYDVFVEINRYGFRDHKDLQQSSPNDIFVVGDSFAFGQGVPEGKRFSNMLQQMTNIPVFNISIPGDLRNYGLLINYARKNGANIKRLIVSICMENDLINYDTKNIPDEHKIKWQLILNSTKQYLTYKMATYNLLTSLIQQNDNFRKLAIKLGLSKGNALMGNEKNVCNTHIIYSSFSQLKMIINGIDSVILIIPSRGLWIGDNTEIERKIHESFVALLENFNLSLVDMKPIFEANGNPLQYHFRHDGHWNELGHAKAAEALGRLFHQTESD